MQKDFNTWNDKKKQIHNRPDAPFFHAREIWWCSFGANVGFEQDGSGEEHTRPALVLKGMSRQTCFVIPLTTSPNKHPLRPSIGLLEGKEAHAIVSQMCLIDSKRLVRRMEYLDPEIFEQIRKIVKGML